MKHLIFILTYICSFCVQVNAQADVDTTSNVIDKPRLMIGMASFYSTNLHGTKTATGATFDNNKLTGASNDFPLNTWVKVTNNSNGKMVIVKINDRMHKKMAKKGRVIDVSRIAAQKLDFVNKGITRVTVESIQNPSFD
jgi:rare lipoprotein A